jgi:putative oxidoreductase
MMNKMCEKMAEPMYAVFRIAMGLLMMAHGFPKLFMGGYEGLAAGFGLPIWLALIVAVVEFFGGLLVAFGFFTRYAAAPVAIVMLVAFIFHSIQAGNINPMINNGELALVFLVSFIYIKAKGSGMFGLEKAIFKKEF